MDNWIDLIRNPGNPTKLSLSEDKITSDAEEIFKIVGNNITYLKSSGLSDEWESRQDVSVSRYDAPDYNSFDAIPELFGSFIAARHEKGQIVFDIGCGISSKLPIYAQILPVGSYLGLEPLTKIVRRDYPCIIGAVSEKIPLADQSVDTIVFATSLDHVEDIEATGREVRRILKLNGRIVIWTGIYDPESISQAKSFHPILYHGSMLKRVVRGLLIPLDYLYLLYRTAQRARKMKNSIPLDNVHFRYYTRQSIEVQLEVWGFKVSRRVVVPGSSSMFIEGYIE